MTGRALVVRGDARVPFLADESVDLVVTSPPYYGLRSYQDGGEHYPGQVGDEQTPAEYIASLIDCTRAWIRVLKPGGSIFVNLGDKYAADARGPDGTSSALTNGAQYRVSRAELGMRRPAHDVPRKSLHGLPWRYALACVDELGLILRAELVWQKPNGLPESANDRVRRSHETWFHFTRERRYYAAIDVIREPHLQPDRKRADVFGGRSAAVGVRHAGPTTYTGPTNMLGRLPGSVWEIPTEPLRVPDELGVDHFAAFPTEWPRRLILGWSPPGICTVCGEGRQPVVDKAALGRVRDDAGDGGRGDRVPGYNDVQRNEWTEGVLRRVAGWVCVCAPVAGYADTGNDGDEPRPIYDLTAPLPATRPAVVLDPFGGTGTTALVASVLGRHGISVDLSRDYSRLARWRTTDRGELARAMRVPKPPQQAEGQGELFAP